MVDPGRLSPRRLGHKTVFFNKDIRRLVASLPKKMRDERAKRRRSAMVCLAHVVRTDPLRSSVHPLDWNR